MIAVALHLILPLFGVTTGTLRAHYYWMPGVLYWFAARDYTYPAEFLKRCSRGLAPAVSRTHSGRRFARSSRVATIVHFVTAAVLTWSLSAGFFCGYSTLTVHACVDHAHLSLLGPGRSHYRWVFTIFKPRRSIDVALKRIRFGPQRYGTQAAIFAPDLPSSHWWIDTFAAHLRTDPL